MNTHLARHDEREVAKERMYVPWLGLEEGCVFYYVVLTIKD